MLCIIKSHKFAQNHPILILKKANWSGKVPLNEYDIFINEINEKKKYHQPNTEFLWSLSVHTLKIGAIHKLCNTGVGEGGPARCYHTILLLLKLIKIWTEPVTGGGGGLKNGPF